MYYSLFFYEFKKTKYLLLNIGENLTDEELYEMLEEADRDGDGMINPDEFYRYEN